ncbi:hypothetical protein NQ317_017822 [Molorchus minor]|uniref:Uncharacterized protein n=1 Tax=Molorchus minor TaxID=1323400 RepID=A0ABQ9K1H0_9CUCU|nr:hypothetical protein NQ317_017822 [Molorchus minor]
MSKTVILSIGLICSISSLSQAEVDGKRWVWDDNNRNEARNRYQVFEDEPYNEAPLRPQLTENERPYNPTLNERPGGVYGSGSLGNGYGEGQSQSSTNYFPQQRPPPGILAGPVPSWVKQGPIKNFDRCKCAERFNCNSPGISYGHCDVGKQYCCYSTNKNEQLGGPIPSRPVHSIENGILAGPGGPVDPIPGVNVPHRPSVLGGPRPGGYLRPSGSYGLRPSGGGFGITPSGTLGNTYSANNGILVGPGGPYDRPHLG